MVHTYKASTAARAPRVRANPKPKPWCAAWTGRPDLNLRHVWLPSDRTTCLKRTNIGGHFRERDEVEAAASRATRASTPGGFFEPRLHDTDTHRYNLCGAEAAVFNVSTHDRVAPHRRRR